MPGLSLSSHARSSAAVQLVPCTSGPAWQAAATQAGHQHVRAASKEQPSGITARTPVAAHQQMEATMAQLHEQVVALQQLKAQQEALGVQSEDEQSNDEGLNDAQAHLQQALDALATPHTQGPDAGAGALAEWTAPQVPRPAEAVSASQHAAIVPDGVRSSRSDASDPKAAEKRQPFTAASAADVWSEHKSKRRRPARRTGASGANGAVSDPWQATKAQAAISSSIQRPTAMPRSGGAAVQRVDDQARPAAQQSTAARSAQTHAQPSDAAQRAQQSAQQSNVQRRLQQALDSLAFASGEQAAASLDTWDSFSTSIAASAEVDASDDSASDTDGSSADETAADDSAAHAAPGTSLQHQENRHDTELPLVELVAVSPVSSNAAGGAQSAAAPDSHRIVSGQDIALERYQESAVPALQPQPPVAAAAPPRQFLTRAPEEVQQPDGTSGSTAESAPSPQPARAAPPLHADSAHPHALARWLRDVHSAVHNLQLVEGRAGASAEALAEAERLKLGRVEPVNRQSAAALQALCAALARLAKLRMRTDDHGIAVLCMPASDVEDDGGELADAAQVRASSFVALLRWPSLGASALRTSMREHAPVCHAHKVSQSAGTSAGSCTHSSQHCKYSLAAGQCPRRCASRR